jgi:hypothetical protein
MLKVNILNLIMTSEFPQRGWHYLPDIITKTEAIQIKYQNLLGAIGDLGNLKGHQDPERGRVLTCYAPASSTFVVQRVLPILEEIVEEELIPSYWFSTTYHNKGYMVRHTDRPSCEISVTMNIDSSVDWPIQLQDLEGNKQKVSTPVGCGLVYSGIDVPHWRTPLRCREEERHMQVFLHYVRKNGKYAEYAYDKNQKCYDLLTQK